MEYERRVNFLSWIVFILSSAYFAVTLPWGFPFALFFSVLSAAVIAIYLYVGAMASIIIGAKIRKLFDSRNPVLKAMLYFFLFSVIGPLLVKWFFELVLSLFFTQTIAFWVSSTLAVLVFILGIAIVVTDYKQREVNFQPKEEE